MLGAACRLTVTATARVTCLGPLVVLGVRVGVLPSVVAWLLVGAWLLAVSLGSRLTASPRLVTVPRMARVVALTVAMGVPRQVFESPGTSGSTSLCFRPGLALIISLPRKPITRFVPAWVLPLAPSVTIWRRISTPEVWRVHLPHWLSGCLIRFAGGPTDCLLAHWPRVLVVTACGVVEAFRDSTFVPLGRGI